MAKIPLPERGQPIDVTYIYELTKAVNDLSAQVSSATYKTTTVNAGTAGPQSVKTSEAKFIGGYVDVANNKTVTASSEVTFSLSYNDFKYAPIVTATPINKGGTPAGQNVTVTLTNVTTTKVDGIVRFNAAGDLTVGVNLIVIGIPN
jgi:hypothetical protein